MASTTGKLFLVLLLLGFSSSSFSPSAEAREGKLFFSKYIHSTTKTAPKPKPISKISESPASAPAPSPAETQGGAYGLWGPGSGMVIPAATTKETTEVYPTYKDDEELEAALDGDSSSSATNYNDDPLYAAATRSNGDGEKQYNLNANYDGNNSPVAADSYKQFNNEEDNHGYSASSGSYNKPYEYDGGRNYDGRPNFGNEKQYRLGGAQYRNGNADAVNQNGDVYYSSSSYDGDDEKTEEFSPDSSSDKNQFRLGSSEYVSGSQQRNSNDGNSFVANNNDDGLNSYNGNGEEPERQGMSDTRFMEGGRYYHDVNQEKRNKNYGNSLVGNYNVNGEGESNFNGNGNDGYREEVKRQGMSDTRFMEGGRYYHDVNQEERNNYPVNGYLPEDQVESSQQENWP